MEKRIELEKRGKNPSQIIDLNLDNCRASQISGLTEEFVNLETLSLINAGLVTLKGFPKLPNLKKLELSDNRISAGLELLQGSPKLQHLNLSGNRIKDYEALEPLKEFHNLVSLDLFNCEVTKIEDYRESVFRMISSLKSLDGYDRNDEEVVDEEDDDDEDSEDSSGEENRIKRDDGNVNEDDAEDDDDDDVENDEENFDEADEEEEDDEEDDDDEEVDLKYLQKDRIDEESDGDDFDPEGDDDEDDDIDEEDDADIEPPAADAKRGQKRKHDEEAGDEAEH